MIPGTHFRVVLVTAPDAKVAGDIARGLVERRLAACVNILPGATSIYRWEGKVHEDAEVLLVIKTRAGLLGELAQFVRERHPAKVPEIIALPITEGSAAYLEWLGASTKFTGVEGAQSPL